MKEKHPELKQRHWESKKLKSEATNRHVLPDDGKKISIRSSQLEKLKKAKKEKQMDNEKEMNEKDDRVDDHSDKRFAEDIYIKLLDQQRSTGRTKTGSNPVGQQYQESLKGSKVSADHLDFYTFSPYFIEIHPPSKNVITTSSPKPQSDIGKEPINQAVNQSPTISIDILKLQKTSGAHPKNTKQTHEPSTAINNCLDQTPEMKAQGISEKSFASPDSNRRDAANNSSVKLKSQEDAILDDLHRRIKQLETNLLQSIAKRCQSD